MGNFIVEIYGGHPSRSFSAFQNHSFFHYHEIIFNTQNQCDAYLGRNIDKIDFFWLPYFLFYDDFHELIIAFCL